MSERLIDLNAVIAPDITVELGEQTFRLPGDAPTEDLLRILVKAQQIEEASGTGKTAAELLEMREDLSAEVEDLFRVRQPDLPEGSVRLSDAQTGELLGGLMSIYSEALADAQAEADEGGGRPTSTKPKPRSGKPSGTNSAGRSRRKRASASSTSSAT